MRYRWCADSQRRSTAPGILENMPRKPRERDMTIAEGLAERIAGVRYGALPPEAPHWAKTAILDTVGCTLAGSVEPK